MPLLRSLRVRARAKVNLDLRILGRREDGYHEIRTIFQTLALHDTLWFSRTGGPFAITATDPEVPLDHANIVWKAARALWRARGAAREPHGVSVRIVKRIPVQAGLGGGSSDAAAALVALNRLWNLKLDAPALFDLAASLGSDVPFFLMGGAALGAGRGEVLYPLPDLPPMPVVLARPREGVSTGQAYAWYASARRRTARSQRLTVPWAPGLLHVRNDFEPVVFRHVPAAARLRRALIDGGAELAMLSGSGSVVFGVFGSDGHARRAAGVLPTSTAGVWVTRIAGRRSRRGTGT